jgi:hypothetical protein
MPHTKLLMSSRKWNFSGFHLGRFKNGIRKNNSIITRFVSYTPNSSVTARPYEVFLWPFRKLLSAVPVTNPRIKPRRILLEGDVPAPIASRPLQDVTFIPVPGIRCRSANILSRIDTDHYAACHLVSWSESLHLTPYTPFSFLIFDRIIGSVWWSF